MLSRLCFVTVLLLATNPAYGQLGTGAISGTIFDQTGAVLPGANVTVTNTGTGFMRETVSSDNGDYRLAGLLPGTYELSVQFSGFSRFVRSGLVLQVDQNPRIDVHLQVGSPTENVLVTAQTPLLQSEQSSVGAVVDRQKIVDLPLNGRNFVQLATLMPGVNTGDGGNPGGGISIAGARPEQNSFLLDGTINSDQFNNLLNFRPSIDILQEFNRNNAVQARNLFDLNPAFQNKSGKIIAPPFNQNQFGFTIGGPVTLPKYKGKNKTFFFGGYEGFRLRRGNTTLTTVPTLEQRRGDFSRNLTTQSLGTDALGRPIFRGAIYDPRTTRTVDGRIVRDPFPGNIITPDQFDPVAAKALALPGFYPLPNTAGSFGSDGNPRLNYFDGRTRSNDFDQFNLRIDQMVSSKDTIFGRYSFNDSDEFNPRTFPGYGESSAIRNQAFTFSNTHILGPTTLNEFRFGYLRYAEFTAAENTVAGRDIVQELGIRGFPFAGSPSLRGAPQFTISGFAGPGDNEGGRPLRLKNNTFQFIDHFSFNTGRHYLKVG